MATITDLPEELLLNIVQGAAHEQSPNSILQLALVSTSFNRITIPILYRSVVQTPADDWLIKILLRDTVKASYIRHLELVGEREEASSSTLTQTEMHQAQNMIDEAFLGGSVDVAMKARWRSDCIDRQSTVHLLALLLPRMTSIRTLSVWDMSSQLWDALQKVIAVLTERARGSSKSVSLHSLETVSFGSRFYSPTHCAGPLTVVSSWPRVRHIFTRNVRDEVDQETKSLFPDSQSRYLALETLQLSSSALPKQQLGSLLGTIKGLKGLEYKFGNSSWDYQLNVPELFGALSQQAGSLEFLSLELATHQYPRASIVTGPTNYASFQSLRKLVIGSLFLFGEGNATESEPDRARDHLLNALPPCIQDFALTQSTHPSAVSAALTSLPALMHGKKIKFTSLEKIEWKCPQAGCRPYAVMRNAQGMRDLAERMGLEFTATITDKSPKRAELLHHPSMPVPVSDQISSGWATGSTMEPYQEHTIQ